MIHPTAQIDPAAVLAAGVAVGPWSVIGAGVEIGAGTHVGSHVVINGPTRIGADNRIHAFCSLGDDPQDKKFDGGGPSRLEIGSRNTIREYCSINRGTPAGGGLTSIGDDNWVMAYCHIAHDCRVGNRTIFANNATLAGHVEIHDYVILGGFTGVHQFCRLGESSFTAIASIVVRDVPPFVMVNGNTARPRSINREGMKRRGMDADAIGAVKRCYKALYRQGRGLEDALGVVAEEAASWPPAARMLEFVRASVRGIAR